MRVAQTPIPGCYQLFPQVRKDNRGNFVKTFHKELFEKHGLATEFVEEYYSCSHKGGVRGLHFQTPPHEHFKLVYCLAGKVLDALVDLRKGAPTFKQYATFELSAEVGNMLYISPGVAHGFYALTDDAVMQYKVTTAHAPRNDCGIQWESAGIPWPDSFPIVSERDSSFPLLQDHISPFQYTH